VANKLFYGDNLGVLRERIHGESVDLVYLDPPFNSAASYNVLFKAPSGEGSAAQIEAFEDTWHWNESAERAFDEVVTGPHSDASIMLRAMRLALGENDMMAYLAMMAVRLTELHRVLKETGSLYLHCDPTASHYLKIILDAVFGATNFRSELIWRRSTAHSDAKQGRRQHGRLHDTILFCTKGSDWTWNQVYTPYDESYLKSHYSQIEEGTGRRFQLDNLTAAKPGGDTSYEWNGVRPYSGRYWILGVRESKNGGLSERRASCVRQHRHAEIQTISGRNARCPTSGYLDRH
jgi:adenine specific DNA methylase Mod